jgi:hypothetical protein
LLLCVTVGSVWDLCCFMKSPFLQVNANFASNEPRPPVKNTLGTEHFTMLLEAEKMGGIGGGMLEVHTECELSCVILSVLAACALCALPGASVLYLFMKACCILTSKKLLSISYLKVHTTALLASKTKIGPCHVSRPIAFDSYYSQTIRLLCPCLFKLNFSCVMFNFQNNFPTANNRFRFRTIV